MPNSSRVERIGHLTFRVMGGKRGKIAAKSGKVGGKSGKVATDGGRIHAATLAGAGGRERRIWRGMRLFKVLAVPDGAAGIELKYHKAIRMSRREPNPQLPTLAGKGHCSEELWWKARGIAAGGE